MVLNKERQSNMELLRVLTMLLIVFNHFSVHGGFEYDNTVLSANRLWTQFLKIGGVLGNNLFVMITGYFLCRNAKFKIEKLLRLILQLLFYSVVITGFFTVCAVFRHEPIAWRGIIKSFFPISTSLWWFATTYVGLYLLSPYLNRLINNLGRSGFKNLLLFLTLIWCVFDTLFSFNLWMNNLLWFVYLYILGAYISLYGKDYKLRRNICFLVAGLMLLICLALLGIFDFLGTRRPVFSDHAGYFNGGNRIPVVTISVFLFLGFSKFEMQNSRTINRLASTVFGIYLIHDHPLVRDYIWGTVFHNASYSDSAMLIPYTIFASVCVYLVCAFLESMRQLLLGKGTDLIVAFTSEKLRGIWALIQKTALYQSI